MNFYSLQDPSYCVSYEAATIKGQAPAKGLFFPEKIPVYAPAEMRALLALPPVDLAFRIMQPYVSGSIPDEVLWNIVTATIDFPFPLHAITPDISALELFHGPTLAFKDVGARFMSRCLGYFSRHSDNKVTVLVATSGDTGGAVANGFLGVEGVEVIILYPRGKVSPIQELQLTTCGQNITALSVEGNFDDCQAIVKEAFTDEQLGKKYQLTSANSINIARWLPQQLYYFFALQQWNDLDAPPVIAVPSGNFGNLGAGLLALKSGLPVQHFIAACNANDAVAAFLQGAAYTPRPAVSTLSNAMDVGDPSNFIRLLEIFCQQEASVRQFVTGYSITDEATLQVIKRVYQTYGYLLDPHGAVAMLSLEQYLIQHEKQRGIFLATAHPVKFPDVVERATGIQPDFPPAASALLHKEQHFISMQPRYDAFKKWMLER
ncbi:MAG: threonine synthase [Bacteroidota bacterium]